MVSATDFTASKAEEAGKRVKLCIANGTSQTCHVCGSIQKMTLKDRVFRCNQCGNIENRDTNSANEVLNRCTVGMTGIEACKSGLSRDMMKQEAITCWMVVHCSPRSFLRIQRT